MFRALGDPTRSKLVYALSLGELCVSDLAGALGASLSATSHQLRILRDLEIVHVRRAGKSQFYSLNEAAFGFCSPRVCQAWKSALAPDSLVRPGAPGPRGARPADVRRVSRRARGEVNDRPLPAPVPRARRGA